MNAQKFTEPGQTKPFAIRFFEPFPDILNANAGVKFLPEFSAILTNIEFYNGEGITRPKKLEPPREIAGMMTANIHVEFWGLQDGKPKRLKETWYFSYVPKNQSPEACIQEIHQLEHEQNMELYRQRLAERPQPFFKTVKGDPLKQIDPWENAKHATLLLLQEEYPLLANATKSKKPAPETVKAFIADSVRIYGHPTSDFESALTLNDKKFWETIGDAAQQHANREKRKSKVDALDWYLTNPKNWIELHALPIEELTRRANKATGFDLSPDTMQTRIGRLQLVTARKRGPRQQS